MTTAFYRDIQPEDLPAPDKQTTSLIQYALRDEIEIEPLSRLITMNPALTAQMLGVVNSAFFGFRRTIKTISEAVVAMGMDRLRSLVLCFAVKEALSQKEIPGFDADPFWEDSVRRGVAAQQLGYLVNGPVEESFTAGMLQDMGLLVLFAMEPDKIDRWPLLRANLPLKRREMEEALFHTTHDSVGGLLAKQWNLPKSYITAISSHHLFFIRKNSKKTGTANEHGVLSGIIYLADLCNAIYTCHDKSGALTILKQQSKALFGLEGNKIEALLDRLPGQVKETSKTMEIEVGSRMDFKAVMELANHKLVEDNISYQELTWQLQRSLRQRDEYAAKLEAELGIAREIQQSLQPDIERIHQVEAFNIPASHLSGDFYDYFVKEDGMICFCLGDVSGKGTSAALLMAKAISLFRCLCKVLDDIGRIVYLMNNELCETAVRGMFVTFVGGWLNPDTCELKIINVGHLPPFLINDDKVVRIGPSSPPLGVLPEAMHAAKNFSIAKCRLYLYTDGFTEGRFKKEDTRKPGKELGLKGFLRWLLHSRDLPLDEQMIWIKDQCREKLVPRSDDLTLMVLSGE